MHLQYRAMERPKRRLNDSKLCEIYWDQLVRTCRGSPGEVSKHFAEIIVGDPPFTHL